MSITFVSHIPYIQQIWNNVLYSAHIDFSYTLVLDDVLLEENRSGIEINVKHIKTYIELAKVVNSVPTRV